MGDDSLRHSLVSNTLDAQPFQEDSVAKQFSSVSIYEKALRHKLQAVTDKMQRYMREINFTTIIDFKRHQVQQPSRSCYRAAKCLCLLISAFSEKQSNQQNPTTNNSFETWKEI